MKKLLLSLLLLPLAANAQEVFDEDQIPTITNTKLSDMTAQTIKMRNNAANGDPLDTKISELTEETDPTSGDYVLCENELGELKKCAAHLLGEEDTDTNVTTICTGDNLLQGDGDCVATPVDTNTNAATICTGNNILEGDGDCVPTPYDTNSQLSEAQVDAFVSNNGYSTGAHTVDTSAATACIGNQVLEGDGDCVPTPVDTNTNLSDSEVETAYNNQVDQVTAGEITNADDTTVHRYSPADIKSFIDTHGSGGVGVTDGDKVDITVSGGGTVWTVDSGAVDYSEIANTPTNISTFTNDSGYITTDTTLSNEDVQDIIGGATTGASGITFTYDDAGNSLDFGVNDATMRATLNVEDGATADQTDSEIATAYGNIIPEATLSDTILGTSTFVKRWTPARLVDLIENQGVASVTADSGLTSTDQGSGVTKISVDAATLRTTLNVEDGATADQTDSEIETAYNTQVSQVSAGEITAGTETAVRRFSPADVKSIVDTHGGGGSSTGAVWIGSASRFVNPWSSNSAYWWGIGDESASMGTGSAPSLTMDNLQGRYFTILENGQTLNDAVFIFGAQNSVVVSELTSVDLTIVTGPVSDASSSTPTWTQRHTSNHIPASLGTSTSHSFEIDGIDYTATERVFVLIAIRGNRSGGGNFTSAPDYDASVSISVSSVY